MLLITNAIVGGVQYITNVIKIVRYTGWVIENKTDFSDAIVNVC